nr:hypothetical protein [Tanacetum cinerariifolium]
HILFVKLGCIRIPNGRIMVRWDYIVEQHIRKLDGPYVFDKYSQLCARNVTARTVINEDTSCGGVFASNWLKRTRYETQLALPMTSKVFSFKGAVNESRTSEIDAFEKYSQLCERNVAPRLAATEVGLQILQLVLFLLQVV